ncbi:unnamed protein product [Hymenolepis diminuta]|uniref:Uncharacterized protein n=1 Tax=Hymenolepis diminuta TaxID=6216 RepID=A0A564YYB5_HYMDI|nr:unnamed protein product [Hymenolepis diminuta]
MIHPPRSSLRNVFSKIIFKLNSFAFAILSDRHWWMINASNKRKTILLSQLLTPREVVAQNAGQAVLPYRQDRICFQTNFSH